MLGVSVHGFADARKSTPSIQSFFGAAAGAATSGSTPAPAASARAASGGSSGPPQASSARSVLPRKPARTSSAAGSSSSSSRPNGLGFPTVTAVKAGVKRRRPSDGAGGEGGDGAGRAAVARRAEDGAPRAGAGASGGDDGGGSDGSGGGRARGGVSAGSCPGSGDREGGTGWGRGADGDSAAPPPEEGGECQPGDFSGGGGDSDADVWCEGVRERDSDTRQGVEEEGEGGQTEKKAAAGGGGGGGAGLEGDVGVEFCGVVDGRGESPNSQGCEVVVGTSREELDVEVRGDTRTGEAAASVEEGLAVEDIRQGRSAGECQESSRSSSGGRLERGDDDADGRPRAMFGKGGASGVFGEVDPAVLAELPPEIQREIWMQQVRRLRTGKDLAPARNKRLPSCVFILILVLGLGGFGAARVIHTCVMKCEVTVWCRHAFASKGAN